MDAEILTVGHPILASKANPVDNVLSNDVQDLITTLIDTAIQANGVGIAAPQIGVNKQIFIVCSKPSVRYPNAPMMKPTPIINPEIVEYSGEIVEDWEGCLSVPKKRGLVPRYDNITVRYQDRQGYWQTKKFSGFVARIFQHEIDHLNGLTFLDRVNDKAKVIGEELWYQQYANQ
ncbi:peptide deformylase [Thalassotalea ganghwensis]